jgi:hypothetical protein
LHLAPWIGEDAAFHGKKKFVAALVGARMGALKNMFLSFKFELASGTEVGARGGRADVSLLGAGVEPAM